MVFGWGKKKQETTDVQKASLALNEIDSILLSKKEDLRKKITTQSKPLFSEIQSELNSIYKIIDHLKSDNLKVDDIEKILRIIVVRAKTEVIEIISKESERPIPQISTFDDVLRASDVASHTLKKIGDVLGKNSRVIHVFAKKYAQELKDHLALVTKNHVIITKMLGEYSTLESSADLIKDTIAKIDSISRQFQDSSSHLSKLRETHSSAESLYTSTQKQIADARQSSEHVQFLELQNKVKQIKAQEDALDKEIDDEFSKVSRSLGKYVYVTSLDKPLKSILERLVERPSKLVGTESTESIKTILESCMKGIVSGTVSVKEVDKSVDQITSLLSSVDGLVSKKTHIKSQIEQIEQNIAQFDQAKLSTLEKQMVKSKSDQEDAKTKIKNLQQDLEQVASQKQDLLKKLSNMLEKTLGVKYYISE